MRLFSIDLPYNLRLPEGIYSFSHEGVSFSIKLEKVKGEYYNEEEPLDEGQVRSSGIDIRGIPKGGSQYELVNKDPVTKGFQFKYVNLRIAALDPEQSIEDDKLLDAINEFIIKYSTFTGDPVPAELDRKDVFIFHEIFINAFNKSYTLFMHVGDPTKHDDAMVLSPDSKEDFEDALSEEPTSSSKFLHKSRHLKLNGYPSASILYAEKSVECLLDELIERNIHEDQEEFLSHIGKTDLDKIPPRMEILGLLVGRKLTCLKEYSQYIKERKKHRNDLFHSEHEVSEDDAEKYLDKVTNLRLALLTNIESDVHLNPPEFEFLNGKKVNIETDREYTDSFEKLPKIEWPG